MNAPDFWEAHYATKDEQWDTAPNTAPSPIWASTRPVTGPVGPLTWALGTMVTLAGSQATGGPSLPRTSPPPLSAELTILPPDAA
jgi:hypothetical protein